MNIGRALVFLLDDPRALRKFGWAVLASLGCLVLVGFFLLSGYQVRIARSVATGMGAELPEWDNVGELLADGARVIAVFVALSLPLFALVCCGGLGLGLAAERVEAGEDPTALLFLLLIYCVPVPFILLHWALSPVIVAQVARTGSAVAVLRLADWTQLVQAARGPAALAAFTAIGLHLLGVLFGNLSCGLLLLAWTPITYFGVGHLAGQLWSTAEASPTV